MRKSLLISFILFVQILTRAQVAISYYPLSSYVGLSTNPHLRIWGDFRMLTNTFISNSNMELYPMVNIRKDSVVRVYVGVGVNFNIIQGSYNGGHYLNGYMLALGCRVSPFRRARNLSFIAELSPYVNDQFSGGNIRTQLGIGWLFRRRHN